MEVLQTSAYPKPWIFFWAIVVLGHCYMDYSLIRKWRSWRRGLDDEGRRGGRTGRAVRIWFSEVFLQRQLLGLSVSRWVIHFLIFWGFIGLTSLSLSVFFLRPLEFFRAGGSAVHFFLQGKGHLFLKVWGDAFGLILLLGLVTAGVRRFIVRPAQQSNSQVDRTLIIYLLWMTFSGFALEGLRLTLVPSEAAHYSFIGSLFIPPGAYTAAELRPWLTACWSLHSFSGVALLFYLPHSKLMHSLLSPLVIGLNAAEEQGRKDLYWPDATRHRPTRSPEA